MKKKIAGIILASVLTFSAMAGVQASAEDRLWENSMEADGVEDDISQNQTEMKDGDDSTSEDNEENTENEGIDLSESDTEAEEDPSEVKEETEISFEEIKNKIFSNDIIYVGGGDTTAMLKIWKECGGCLLVF